MTTTTRASLSEKDSLLVYALHDAKRALLAVRLEPFVEERTVREILRDISCDTLEPLPVAIEVLLPADSLKIMSQERMAIVIAGIDRFSNMLIPR